MKRKKSVKVALVDDDADYRRSLKALMTQAPGVCIYREYDSGLDFIREAHSPFIPDVCIVDQMLPDVPGIECARYMKTRHPAVGIIIITALPDLNAFLSARQIGADYMEKNGRFEFILRDLVFSVDRPGQPVVSVDDALFSGAGISLIKAFEESARRFEKLSASQKSILFLRKEGMTIREIARSLKVHTGTVATQLSRAYMKLELPDPMDFIGSSG